MVNTPITSDFSLENPSVDQNVLIEVLKKQKAEGVSECLDILEKMNQKDFARACVFIDKSRMNISSIFAVEVTDIQVSPATQRTNKGNSNNNNNNNKFDESTSTWYRSVCIEGRNSEKAIEAVWGRYNKSSSDTKNKKTVFVGGYPGFLCNLLENGMVAKSPQDQQMTKSEIRTTNHPSDVSSESTEKNREKLALK